MSDEQDFSSIVFTAELENIGVNEGNKVSVDIQINRHPFVLTGIRHEIVKDGLAPVPPVQDGMYRINWSKDDQTKYFKGSAPMARSYLGSVTTGIWTELPQHIIFQDAQTINVEVINALQGRPHPFTVHLQFHGVQKTGVPKTND